MSEEHSTATSKYDYENDDWTIYCEELEGHFVTHETPDEKRVNILLSQLPSKTYEVLQNLLAPHLPSSKSFEEIKRTLEEHLKPKRSVFMARYAFHKRDQIAGENIREYVAVLRKLAEGCGFGALQEELIRDRSIFGVTDEAARKKLLIQMGDELELHQVALSIEAASAGVPTLVEPLIQKKRARSANAQCRHCGRRDHSFQRCRFRNSTCFVCGTHGHIRSVCDEWHQWNNCKVTSDYSPIS